MKAKRCLSLLLVIAMLGGMLAMFGGLTVTAAEISETDKQLLGYGYNVTAGKALSRSSLVIAQPILDVNDPEVLNSIYVMDLTEQTATNMVAESAKELTTKIGSSLAGGISGNIAVVNMDISAMFDKSQTVANAISERYEIYSTEIAQRQVILQMEVSELRQHLSARFEQDIASLTTEEEAIVFLNKYGTHLFTGYKLGGRMSVTNYRVTNSQSVNLDQAVDLKAQVGAAAASAGAGISFSISEKYGVDASDTSQKSTYHFVAQGGKAVAGLTLDQLFTYNPNLVGDGKYMYQAWIDAINAGTNLDIIDAANGAQAIPVWELLEQTPANSRIRGLLVRAYAKLCGDKYNEYNAKYPYLNRDFGEESDDFYPTGTIAEYYTSATTENGNAVITGPNEIEDGTSYTVACNSTLYMVADCEIKTGEKNWRIITGAGNAEIIDSVDGVVHITGADGGSFTMGLYSGEAELDSVTFQIKSTAFSGGLGTEAEPYLISTVGDLQALLSQSSWFTKSNTYYLMTNDIDASTLYIGTAMTESQSFKGIFDGGYYKICNYQAASGSSNNYYPSGSGIVGLFGHNSGTIKNLKLENVSISMPDEGEVYPRTMIAGVLVGDNSGEISNCVVSNSKLFVKNDDTAEKESGAICYVYAGGLAGRNSGSIVNSGVICTPVHGEVKIGGNKDVCGVAAVGGMVGVLLNDGRLIGCYVQYDTSDGESRTQLVAQIEGHNPHNNLDADELTSGRAYAGGLIGWAVKSSDAAGGCLVDCVIDVPKVLYAFLNNCDPEAKVKVSSEHVTEQYAGSVVGKSNVGAIPDSTDFLQRNIVLAVSSRAPLKVPQSAEVKDGAGYGFMPLSEAKRTVRSCASWGYSALSAIPEFNKDIWTSDAAGNVVNKSSEVESLQVSGYGKEFEYNRLWSPVGTVAQLNTKAGSCTLKTYVVNLGGFTATDVKAYTFKVMFAGKEVSDVIKVVNTNIHKIEAQDTSAQTLYMDDLYDLTGRELSVEAILTNGQRIALMVNGVMQEQLSYVNYPQNAAVSFPNAKALEYGENMVTLSYGEHTCAFIVRAVEDMLTDIEIKQQPNKKSYAVGNRFSAGGMVVEAMYESGATKIVENSTLELIGATIAEGENVVVVSYGNYVTDEVSVNGFVPLAVKTMPTKTVYNQGEAIDWTGLTLNYTEDGVSYRQLTAAECTRSAEIVTAVGNNEITLSYGGFSAKITLVGREKTTYQIVFIGKDGTVLLSQSYEEGQAVTPPTPPVVEGYTFTGWDKEITAANANTTYVAIYTLNTPGTPDPPEEQTYQIIFIGRNGVVLSSENYTAGQTVTVPTPPAVNGYTFVGWDKVITVANANTVYTAIYEAIPSYLITFLGRDNTVLSAEYYNQDQTVTPPTPPTVEGYTFVGWNKTVTAATANAVYVAVYRADAPEVSEADRARLAKADTNGDGVITHEDAVLLLQRVHFGEVVLYASGDINNDGRLTSDDAIRLEKYVQDPEANPIG
ncbi:MAG: InlB B-repeat-containing protein [Clostridia bacterium]|nr:InlB B-repeat-containing protein [Clostridia bacterium]